MLSSHRRWVLTAVMAAVMIAISIPFYVTSKAVRSQKIDTSTQVGLLAK